MSKMKRRKSIIQIIKTSEDIELLEYLGDRMPHLKKLIYKRIRQLTGFYNG